MTVDEIIEVLQYPDGIFPREEITEAVARQEEITPKLLEILKDVIKNPRSLIEDEDYWGHIFAMFLLAQFREQRACPLIVEFFSNPDEKFLDTTGDVLTEDLPRLLGSVCDGDTSWIEELVENDSANEFSRAGALGAFQCLFVNGIKSREEVVEYYRSLFNKLERKPSYIWGNLILQSVEIYATELYPEIKKVFDDDLEQENVIDLEYTDKLFSEGEEKRLAEIRKSRQNRFIGNVIEEMENWFSFKEEPVNQPYLKPTLPSFFDFEDVNDGTPFIAPPKVGKNEPCPCGSGLKFKKCCGT